MNDILGEPQFELGMLRFTEAAHQLVEGGLLAQLYIDRHWRGDAGCAVGGKKEPNRAASCFDTPLGTIWIVTDICAEDGLCTTVMTHEES
jgi:hypothetical protein